MISIQEIADDIYNKIKPKSPQEFIYNFEKYENIIDNLDYKLTSIDYDAYSRIIADYGIALVETKSYKKAIPVIDKALDLLQNNKRFTRDELQSLEFYEVLLFNRGRSYYYLKNFELSQYDFKLLTKSYPNNSTYPKWIFAIENKNFIKLKNVLWYCLLGLEVIYAFIPKRTLLKNMLLGLACLLLLSTIFAEGILYYKRKKSNSTH